jgi:hypothetical protein
MLFEYLNETRRVELLPVAEEAVKNYSANSKDDLVTLLLPLWREGAADRVTGFARKALAGVTGLESPRRDDYARWAEDLATIVALEGRHDASPDDASKLLRSLQSGHLKNRIASLANKRGWFEVAEALIQDLGTAEPAYRRQANGFLALWTGREAAPPKKDDPAAWLDTIHGWQDWWREHGEEWLDARRKARREAAASDPKEKP